MGATLSILKSLTLPALIALVLYLITTYLVVPLWRRHHSRYTSYIPLPTSIQNLTTQTNSFRQRLQDTLTRTVLPSTWQAVAFDTYRSPHSHTSSQDFNGDSGEELEEVDEARRREALSLDARRGRGSDDRRLSRDLEEGFKDDSDDEGAEVIANLARMGMITMRER